MGIIRKSTAYLLVALLLAGCAGTDLNGRVAGLEKEITKLKTDVRIAMAGGAAGTGQIRWRPGLLGGGDNLDAVGCDSMNEGYAALVPVISGTTASFYVYVWDEDCTASESSPLVIVPDDRATNCSGNGCWRLSSIHAPSFVGSSADGTHYINMSNSGDLDAGERADGRCWYDRAQNRIECYDGTNIQYWTATGNQ